jgi:hypothetical protein
MCGEPLSISSAPPPRPEIPARPPNKDIPDESAALPSALLLRDASLALHRPIFSPPNSPTCACTTADALLHRGLRGVQKWEKSRPPEQRGVGGCMGHQVLFRDTAEASASASAWVPRCISLFYFYGRRDSRRLKTYFL